MRHAIFAATAALALSLGGSAFAESNDLAAVEMQPAPNVVRGGGVSAVGGSEAYPAFAAARSVPVTAGDGLLLPTVGSEGPVQSASSLPHGFSEGTVAYEQAESVARFLAQSDQRARATARNGGGSPRG
ncbi:MAG: hypothetical protein JOZ42_01155 [Acetobacteraceae bacterium]|nr:hypothetical protein [Acetobacteraceae bacterium]